MRRSACLLALALSGGIHAEPVTYTFYAVTDGALGTQGFSESTVRLQFRGDTQDLVKQTATGVLVYRMDRGDASVTVTSGGVTKTARITAGQVYVYYDVLNALVGIGSYAVGPGYPLSLNCPAYRCPTGTAIYTVGALADLTSNPGDSTRYSHAVSRLPATLAKPTLLTGPVSACAVPYLLVNFIYTCPYAPATAMLQTDAGGFYLQDMQGFEGKGMFVVDTDSDGD